MQFSYLRKEKERQQYDKEIEELQKQLEELRRKGPSDQQLALKRRLDEQCEKKGIHSRLLSMVSDIKVKVKVNDY